MQLKRSALLLLAVIVVGAVGDCGAGVLRAKKSHPDEVWTLAPPPATGATTVVLGPHASPVDAPAGAPLPFSGRARFVAGRLGRSELWVLGVESDAAVAVRSVVALDPFDGVRAEYTLTGDHMRAGGQEWWQWRNVNAPRRR